MKKGCQIYKTKDSYKITTLYQRESGSYIVSNPIDILPIDIDKEILCDNIFKSLETSHLISEKEEGLYDINLLKALKEKSYISFYKKSKCCMIFLEDNTIVIQPQVLSSKFRGLETVHDKIVTVNINSKAEVLEALLKILE